MSVIYGHYLAFRKDKNIVIINLTSREDIVIEALSKRDKEILRILTKDVDYVPADKIANILHISKKTVYRDLKSIEQKLDKNIICKQQGKGYY